MKPPVNRVASVPATALLCCPHCYRLISYEPNQKQVGCHGCGTIVTRRDLPLSLDAPAQEQ